MESEDEDRDEETVLQEIDTMEFENAKEILEIELEELDLSPKRTSSSEGSEYETLLQELDAKFENAKELLEMFEESDLSPKREGSEEIKDLLSKISSRDAEAFANLVDKLVDKCLEMGEISKKLFDSIFEALINTESEFFCQTFTILEHILVLAENQFELTEGQLAQLVSKIGSVVMGEKSTYMERDATLFCLIVLSQYHFSLLLQQHKCLLIPKCMAFVSGQMQLYEEMIEWTDKLIGNPEFDVGTISSLKEKSILLLYVVILATMDKLSATLLELILPQFEHINSEQFGEEWEKLSKVSQLLVVSTLLGSLSVGQVHDSNANFFSEIVLAISDTTGAWQTLDFYLYQMLSWEDKVVVTGTLKAIKGISKICHTNGLVQFKGAVNNFYPEVLKLLGKNTAVGPTLKEMTLCRPTYVVKRETRMILLEKLEKYKSDPGILDTCKQLRAEDRVKWNANSPHPLPKTHFDGN